MIRTRFAPSPTGYLHIGGARTALYCWLYARKTNGTFILRIEDTDRERSTDDSVQAILDGMQWLALDYDEGPFYQTHRFEAYKKIIQKLLDEGKAYRCYCTKEHLEALRIKQIEEKLKPRYDGLCRHLTEKQHGEFCVRFKNPEEGVVEFDDLIRGKITVANQELDDLIIARSDGTPTYNFTVVVDDYDMKITHVIRGDDHINNTPRQINLLRALGAEPPLYAHVPMILGADGKRLSKRHGAVGVMQFREDGFLPDALLNYLVRLGWAHGDQEIFSRDEMIQFFDLAKVNSAPAAFNLEKLLWLNQHYIKHGDKNKTLREFVWHLEKMGVDENKGPDLSALISAQADRCKTLKEMAEKSVYFFEEPVLDEAANALITEKVIPALKTLHAALAECGWTKEAIHTVIKEASAAHDMKMGDVAQPLRVLMTGGTVSPSIDLTILLIGRERALQRMEKFL